MTPPKKGLKTRHYNKDMNMDNNVATLPKKGLKTRPLNMDMDKDIATLPKKSLKTRLYNIGMEKKGLKKYDYNTDMDMEKEYLKKLSKGQLIKLLLKQKESKKVSNHEDLLDDDPFKDEIAQETAKPRTDRPLQMQNARRPPKPTRKPPQPPKPKDDFNFDDDIFQTENTSLGNFKIISVRSRENKKFKSYTNEFKVKILKELDDVKEIYHIFQELVKTVKKRRKLSDNDMLRLVIQNEELPNAISTKFNKVENFKLGDLETVIKILEYRGIPLETSKIVVQSVKIPTGKGRLYLTKDTISRKGCIITVKNDDTTCLARSIVTAMANLHPEKWTKTQLHNGFNKSRKLQKEQAMKLHEEVHVEINDYGNDLSDIEKFAKHLGIEINIVTMRTCSMMTHLRMKLHKRLQNQGLTDHFKCKLHEDPQNPLENHLNLRNQRTISILMMTYSKLKTQVLEISK